MPPRTNGLAIAALAVGIFGIWPLALIFGYISKGQIDRSNGAETGRGMAVAGIVLGWAWVLLAFLAIVAITLLGNNAAVKFSQVGNSIN